ncbi:MAG: hypothetical protein KF785_12915 [Gemmatimonadales bacterium]|nr:hypothetical protein [Gemmatimonadales bacterium]
MSCRFNTFALLFGLAAGLGSSPATAQRRPVTQALATVGISGQGVAIVPVNLLVIEPSVEPGVFPAERVATLRRIDSVLADDAAVRAPDVNWISADELRRIARRSGGLMGDPNQMGQSVMRAWSMATVPDPLRSNLRKLLAAAGGWRYALIPASVTFQSDSLGALEARMSIVLADVRTGKVVWRSVARGSGDTPDQALKSAVATVFPVDDGNEES